MDSGENWTELNTGLPPDGGFPGVVFVPLVAVSPTTPATVYTGYYPADSPATPAFGHLAKSSDGGITWKAADGGLSYVDVRAVAIDPAISSKIYAGMGGASSSIPLFTSADGGASWASFAQFDLSGPAASYGWISYLLVASASPNLVYAAATTNNGYYGLFKTTDGGANWIRSGSATLGNTLGGPSRTVMTLDPANSDTIYLGGYDSGNGGGTVYKSVDGGSTWVWTHYWEDSGLNALAIDPGNRAILYAGTSEGVFQSADSGASWSHIGLSMGVSSLALDPGDPNTIYAAAGGGANDFSAGFLGLFKSTDAGATWAPINNGLASVLDSRSTVTAIAFAPSKPNAIYVATSGRGVYKSLDGGASWEPFNEGLTNLDVRALAVASNALYAVTSSGIFKTIDYPRIPGAVHVAPINK